MAGMLEAGGEAAASPTFVGGRARFVSTLALCGGLLGCGPGSSSSSGSGTDGGSGTGPGVRELVVPAGFEMCAVSPVRTGFQGQPLFHYRGHLRVDPAVFSLPPADGEQAQVSFSFSLQPSPSDYKEYATAAFGSVRVEADSVPSSVYFLEPAPGWETAILVDVLGASPQTGDDLLVQVAYPTGTSELDLNPIVDLDRDRRLWVTGWVDDATANGTLRATFAPCTQTDLPVDRIDVQLAEGKVSFHTRPAVWGSLYGYTVLAQGDVDGIHIDVDDYWNLDYATDDMGSGSYGVDPTLAARFDPQPDGACILLLEPDLMAFDGSYLATILDCQQTALRTLTVESVMVVAGAGSARW